MTSSISDKILKLENRVRDTSPGHMSFSILRGRTFSYKKGEGAGEKNKVISSIKIIRKCIDYAKEIKKKSSPTANEDLEKLKGIVKQLKEIKTASSKNPFVFIASKIHGLIGALYQRRFLKEVALIQKGLSPANDLTSYGNDPRGTSSADGNLDEPTPIVVEGSTVKKEPVSPAEKARQELFDKLLGKDFSKVYEYELPPPEKCQTFDFSSELSERTMNGIAENPNRPLNGKFEGTESWSSVKNGISVKSEGIFQDSMLVQGKKTSAHYSGPFPGGVVYYSGAFSKGCLVKGKIEMRANLQEGEFKGLMANLCKGTFTSLNKPLFGDGGIRSITVDLAAKEEAVIVYWDGSFFEGEVGEGNSFLPRKVGDDRGPFAEDINLFMKPIEGFMTDASGNKKKYP